MSVIKIDNMRKSFGKTEVIRGLSFELFAGESVALLGGNGAGKTTALRILCGVMSRDDGTVLVGGIDPAQSLESKRLIGVVGDREGLYERLTVREYFRYFASLQGVAKADQKDRISELSKALHLGSLLDRRMAGFSQGERMKVALGRALLHKPQILLLDEPTRGLDVPSVRLLRKVLDQFLSEGGTLLFSSHVMQEVEGLADRILIMADGQIVASGRSDELKALAKVDTLEDAFVNLSGMEVEL